MSSTANLGLEGVVAFETEIAEPDKEGSALRYRGVDIEELAGHVPFEQVWGLIVNESLERGLPLPAPECEPVPAPAYAGSPAWRTARACAQTPNPKPMIGQAGQKKSAPLAAHSATSTATPIR